MTDILQRASLQPLLPSDPRQRASKATLYLLGSDFTVETDILGRTTIPAGFLTDLASVPRVFYDLLDPEDPCILYPSLPHDYWFFLAGLFPDGRAFKMNQANRGLRELMLFCGAPVWIADAAYEAVELGGASHWGSKT